MNEPTLIHTETYEGREITITYRPAGWQGYTQDAYLGAIDGRRYGSLRQATEAKALKSSRHAVDVLNADRALRPVLAPLIANYGTERPGGAFHFADEAPEVGTVAVVFSRGAWRRGLVEKVGRTNVTVAYVTNASPENVTRKAAPLAEVGQARRIAA